MVSDWTTTFFCSECIYMYVSVYTFFSFLKTFFPFCPSGPHFAEYLHWDVTEECEVRLVCKVRYRFHPGAVTIREMVRSHLHCFILCIIWNALFTTCLYYWNLLWTKRNLNDLISWIRRKRSHSLFLSGLNHFRSWNLEMYLRLMEQIAFLWASVCHCL